MRPMTEDPRKKKGDRLPNAAVPTVPAVQSHLEERGNLHLLCREACDPHIPAESQKGADNLPSAGTAMTIIEHWGRDVR